LKNKTYILLTAVLGIWGTVAYKIVNGISPHQPEVTTQNFDVAFHPKQQKAIDTFSIKSVVRDPFLGTLSTEKKILKQTKKVKPAVPDVKMPTITYGGLIQKTQSKAKIFVVNIDNKQYLLKQGQTAADVKLVRGSKSSIVVRFNGKNQTIKL